MGRRNKHPEPFFMIFPWFKAFGLLLLLAFIVVFIFRLSETGGPVHAKACMAAIITTVIGAACGIYPATNVWRKEFSIALIAVMIGTVIRLLITGSGIAIITFFTQINKSWYVLYVGIFYVVFLAVDAFLTLWLFAHCRKNNREHSVHGNLWNMVS